MDWVDAIRLIKKEQQRNPGAMLHQQLVNTVKPQVAAWQNALISQDDLFGAFLQEKIEYKGQLVQGFSNRGGTVKAGGSVDFGELVCPVFTIEVGGSLSYSTARSLLLVISRLPRSLETFETNRPITFNCLLGIKSKVNVTGQAEVGFKTPGLPIPEDSKLDKATTYAGFAFEAKATASVSASNESVLLRARDESPNFYPAIDDKALKSDFSMMLGPGNKAQIKANVLAFFDNYSTKYPPIKKCKPEKSFVQTWITHGNIAFAVLWKSLSDAEIIIQKDDKIDKKLKQDMLRDSAYHKMNINAFKEYNIDHFVMVRKRQRDAQYSQSKNKAQALLDMRNYRIERDSKLCFLELTSGKSEGGASAQAKFNLEAFKNSVSAAAGIGISGYLKTASYRYQTFGRDDESRVVVCTQDTVLQYKQLTGKKEFGITAEGPFGRLSGQTGAFHNDQGERTKEKEFDLYNAISYESAVIFWTPPENLTDREVEAKTGSGVSFGHSTVARELVEHFVGIMEGLKTPDDRLSIKNLANSSLQGHYTFLAHLANGLKVEMNSLLEFISSCRNTLVGLYTKHKNKDIVVIVESCFSVPPPGGKKKKIAVKMTGPDFVPVIAHGHDSFMTNMAKDPQEAQLQAIRLRVRRAETLDRPKTRFRLGFGISKTTKVGIELLSVEEAGSEGVVDLHTYWFYPYAGYNDRSNDRTRGMGFDAAVPPVALFCQ